MKDLYHPEMYRTDRPSPSYWRRSAAEDAYAPLRGDHQVDVAIVGGGFTGLSAALHLARDHGIDVALVDAGEIGWGATSRNAGFNTLPACKLGLPAMQRIWGAEATADFYASQLEGVRLAEALAAEEGFDLGACGSGTYVVAHGPGAWRELQQEVRDWKRATDVPVALLDRDAFAEIGHGGAEQHGAMSLPFGGGLDPVAYSSGLARAAARRGARLYGRSAVERWERHDGRHVLHTAGGTLQAQRVIVATNGYPTSVAPRRLQHRVLPVISNIVVTEPLSDAQWAAHGYRTFSPIADSRHLLHYYRRLPDNRLLFGGRGDFSGTDAEGARMQARLLAAIVRKFPAWDSLRVDHFWRGMVAITRKLAPSFGCLPDDPTVWYGFGCFGNGVNTMPWIGRTLARRIAGVVPTRTERCAVYAGLPARLPPINWMKTLGLRAAYGRYALLDALAA